MNCHRIMLVAFAALLLGSSLAWANQADVRELLARMPEEMEFVVASPNLPEAMAGLRRWIGTLDHIPVDAAKSAGMMLETVQSVSAGAAVVGFRTEEQLKFLGLTATAENPAKVIQALIKHGRAIEGRTIAFGPREQAWGFCALRDGLLVFGSSAALVQAEYPVEPEAGFLADPSVRWLLEHSDAAKPDCFLLTRPGAIAMFEDDEQPQEAGMAAKTLNAIMRRVSNALKLKERKAEPSIVTLDFHGKGFALSDLSLKRIPDENDPPALPVRLDRLDAAFSEWPIRLIVSGCSFDDIVGAVEAAETRFDPDVGAEFKEEMAELDRDLGLHFREDFLGSLGDDWAVLVRQVDDAPQWTIWSEVRDAEAFLGGARAVAKLAEEPWQEGTNPGDRGGWVVNTRAFGVPLTLAGHDREMAAANGAAAARAAFRPVEPEVRGDEEPSHVRARCVVGLRALGQMLEGHGLVGTLGTSWTALPGDATLTLGFADLDYGRQSTLSLDGVNTWDINFFLGPLLGNLKEARAEAQVQVCKANIGQILKASITYQEDHEDQWPPNLQALFPKYLDNEAVLICPAAGKEPSYRFFGSIPFRLVFSSCPVVYDLNGNHPGGRNVGCYDGHVWWYEEAEFQDMLRRRFRHLSNAINKAKERGEDVDLDMDAVKDFFTDFGTME